MTATNHQLSELIHSLDAFLSTVDLCFRDDESYTKIFIQENDEGWETVKKALYGVHFSESYGSNLHSLMWSALHLRQDFHNYLAAFALEQLKNESRP